MPNTSAARKDLRQTAKRTVRNLAKKSKIRELTKDAQKAIAEGSNDVKELVIKAQKALDKAGKANAVHPNKVSRLKSRLQKAAAAKK
ncbi:MAG: 30S ribosomal protein S20 [Candidatus Kerfeldbacteria bacterium CG15_BIG_FIL_POST_REV_8_21_14_020_45_12]|uniref:Small ribosomal subunit protein bS20 n=1 Tax=Candidatus Kerfeldbacteria bacterium CG15_BIG_FIL_POST_REV_8_21_14_020_45_12 TaxID=2014247 RepID=A0A2M7H343_9BACT|nr:MAG: 30S ribosomal protein S20 [Candidatus Kerfeldbacteria bacterium CG15_BIG_FIL_POST_REV_8_21_14_020_45_12]PJA93310.1 MAG: 30S ribosomal protein S20 [Candidatus Kerfeldbacteria bacterium CG_4_9_14_3_um_filter_45_8]